MAVVKVYTRINWLNKSESLTTPLGKTNLNKMDKAIDTIDNEVVSISATAESLDTTKADKDQLNNMITDISVNDKNGVISITKYNGTVLNIDTAMEKIAVNFEYNAQTQQLILTLENGKKQYIDMSALITQYEFKGTDTIAFSIDSDGKVKASIKSGSITKAMLSSEVMSAITLSESNAVASAQAAAQSATNADMDAKLSQSYSVGKSGIRDGEDTDNAKYYSEQAEKFANEAKDIVGSNFITQAEKGVANGVAVLNTNLAVEKAVGDEKGNDIQGTYAKKSDTMVNLFSPELHTTTVNGITCVDNHDGTYTVKGTATSDVMIEVGSIPKINKKIKICGSPSGASLDTYGLYFGDIIMDGTADVGNGVIYYRTDEAGDFLFLFVKNGKTVDNVVFKPMITTNINATYSDFIQYTGDTGNISGDVADIKKDTNDLKLKSKKERWYTGERYTLYGEGAPSTSVQGADVDKNFCYLDVATGTVYNLINVDDNGAPVWKKVSKTLREVTDVIHSKLDIEKVANNLVTTNEGYALDARQGAALDEKIAELKKSVSDGKSAIASAITNEGVSTASDASFDTMVESIGKIFYKRLGTQLPKYYYANVHATSGSNGEQRIYRNAGTTTKGNWIGHEEFFGGALPNLRGCIIITWLRGINAYTIMRLKSSFLGEDEFETLYECSLRYYHPDGGTIILNSSAVTPGVEICTLCLACHS